MGLPYEIASIPSAYTRKASHNLHAAPRDSTEIVYGYEPNQAFILYEPAQPAREEIVIYFHGGGYLVGAPQSMGAVADVFNSWGYRFISMGFRLLGNARFPAQIDDAFNGINAALSYLDYLDVPHDSLIVGGASAGALSAGNVAYNRKMLSEHGLDAGCISGLISIAGVLDASILFNLSTPANRALLSRVDVPRKAKRDIASLHQALSAYSPFELIDHDSHVPMLAVHGAFDTLSPYGGEVRFAEKLNILAGDGTATLYTLDSPRYQHLKLTASVFTEDPKSSEALLAIHRWLERNDLR